MVTQENGMMGRSPYKKKKKYYNIEANCKISGAAMHILRTTDVIYILHSYTTQITTFNYLLDVLRLN